MKYVRCLMLAIIAFSMLCACSTVRQREAAWAQQAKGAVNQFRVMKARMETGMMTEDEFREKLWQISDAIAVVDPPTTEPTELVMAELRGALAQYRALPHLWDKELSCRVSVRTAFRVYANLGQTDSHQEHLAELMEKAVKADDEVRAARRRTEEAASRADAAVTKMMQ